jgi:hypothetical protein
VRRLREAGRERWRSALRFGLVTGLLGLAACSVPIDAWRGLRGFSKNDPDPAKVPFSENLAAGNSGDFPNLATVPEPPVRALTEAERAKLMQGLVASRTDLAHSDAKIRAGDASMPGATPPPPPPILPAIDLPTPAKTASAEPPPKPPPLRKSGEPPEPQPLQSSLVSPEARSVPNPEQARSPPPRPGVAPAPAPAKQPPPPPAAMAAVEPPPPPAVQPAPVPAAVLKSGAAIAAAAPAPPLAEIRFAAGATAIGAADRTALEKLAPGWRDQGGKLRIVAYAATAGGADEQLDRFHAALARAQAVAAVLTDAGIPGDHIQVRAAPAEDRSAADRAVVLPVP